MPIISYKWYKPIYHYDVKDSLYTLNSFPSCSLPDLYLFISFTFLLYIKDYLFFYKIGDPYDINIFWDVLSLLRAEIWIPDWWAVFITVFAIFIQYIGDESLAKFAS